MLKLIIVRTLSIINSHPRDKNISFQNDGHLYKILGLEKRPISVTTLIHNNFPQFDSDKVINNMMSSRNWKSSKYYGKTVEQIKNEWKNSGETAANLGTLLHADIERFYNGEQIMNPNTQEFNYFVSFWDQFQQVNKGFEPYRTEWLIYDEDKGIAGSIDCVLRNAENKLILIDWKRSKEIKMENKYEKGLGVFSNLDNCNYWHYLLQLNIYRHILETKYSKMVAGMYIVVLHPNNSSYLVYMVQRYDIASIWDQMF